MSRLRTLGEIFKELGVTVTKIVCLVSIMYVLSVGLCAVRDWCTTGEVDFIDILNDYQNEEQMDEEIVLTEMIE